MSLVNRELPVTPQTYLLYTDNQDTGTQLRKQARNEHSSSLTMYESWRITEKNEKLTKRLYSKM